MSGLLTEQIYNTRTIQIYIILKNCGLFMTEYHYRLYCKIIKVKEYQYRNKIQQYIDSCGQTYQIYISDILQ